MIKTVHNDPQHLNPYLIENLEFFFRQSNLPKVLDHYSLSFKWLPFLINLELEDDTNILANWIVSKTGKPADLVEIVNEIEFGSISFIKKLKEILESKSPEKNPLKKSWKLIIQHIKDDTSHLSQMKWEKLLESMKNGDFSPEIVDNLIEFLRPRIVVYPKSEFNVDSNVFADIFWIEFSSIRYVLVEEIVEIWHEKADPNAIKDFFLRLTTCLNTSLQKATTAGISKKFGGDILDSQIRSIAEIMNVAERIGYHKIGDMMVLCGRSFSFQGDSKAYGRRLVYNIETLFCKIA